MGLFDFLKKDKKEQQTTKVSVESAQKDSENRDEEAAVVYELQIKASTMGLSQETLQQVVTKMVEEDPFQNFYEGKEEADYLFISRKIYQYAAITTMNIQIISENQELFLVVENQKLGKLSTVDKKNVEQYVGRYLLTGYAYILGGESKQYSTELQGVVTANESYDLEITLQFS